MENNKNVKDIFKHHEDVYSERDFDLKVVKKMTNYQFLCNENPLFHWPIVDQFGQMVNAERSWTSERFPIFGNDETFGQMGLKFSKNTWTLSLTLDRYAHSASLGTDVNSYFVCRHTCTNPTNVDQRHIMLFGTITDKSTASIDWSYSPDRRLQSILIETYQFSADIPNYISSNKNVVVGKIIDFYKQARENTYNPYYSNWEIEVNPRVSFGSEGNRRLTVRFLNNLYRAEKDLLFSTNLSFVKDGEDTTSVSLAVTFTVFSENENAKDFVKKIVLSGEEKKREIAFDHSLILTFYEHINKLLMNDVLYFKVVLESVKAK